MGAAAGVNSPGSRWGEFPDGQGIHLEPDKEEKYFQVCWFVRIPKWFGGRLRIAILVPKVKESTAGSP